MKIKRSWQSIEITGSTLKIRRGSGGVVEVEAANPVDLQKGLGFAHAADRGIQMLLTRLVGRGEITHNLMDNEEGYAFDLLIRKMGFRRDVENDLANLTPETLLWMEAYCEGVNAYFAGRGKPLIPKLLKIPIFPWTLSDTLVIAKMLSYVGVAQQQERLERFLVHAIHDGVSVEKLKKLFSPYLEELDEEIVSLIQKLHLTFTFHDQKLRFQPLLSNNWVISPEKSASGAPLAAGDPHLQINRIPSSWYEAVGRWGDKEYIAGITLPGAPGWLMGRTRYLSASFTYGMLDTTDFFIEEIKGGNYRRGNRWIPLKLREETIFRKKEGRKRLLFYETDAGVLERPDPSILPIQDGYYLSLAWSCLHEGASPILNNLHHAWSGKTVDDMQMFLWNWPVPCNWAIADREGNIGMQQSGRVPKRKGCGLVPLPAWKEENLWQGFYKGTDLVSELNPERGFCGNANDNKDHPQNPPFCNVAPDYRYRRIHQVLSSERKLTKEDMKALQLDVYSVQAEEFMNVLSPLLPQNPQGDLLRSWDFFYHKESKAATLFEEIYHALKEEVFAPMFGAEIWKHYGQDSPFISWTFQNFDRILFSSDPSWFGEEGKEALFRRVIEQTLAASPLDSLPTWGEKTAFSMNYILFDGKLPTFLGFDIDNIQLGGSRATVDTFQTFYIGPRKIVTGTSYRFVTDMGEDTLDSCLPGGVSEKLFSPLYKSDLPLWLSSTYKTLVLEYPI
ncbi:MAG: Acyl-homoserine lactone acylase QuiP [Chlamydiae bacterium]|nr:Acyl-homoserine lactone acylase QuiP [Chlamydiota bacterium]